MLGFGHDRDYDRVREVFQSGEYTGTAISKAIGREDILRMPTSDVPQVLRRTRESSRLNTLIRLYFLGLPVPVEEARSALAPLPLESWVEAELLSLAGPRRSSSSSSAVLAGGWPDAGGRSAVEAAESTPTEFRSATRGADVGTGQCHDTPLCASALLDLGTGSGMLALSAAPVCGIGGGDGQE